MSDILRDGWLLSVSFMLQSVSVHFRIFHPISEVERGANTRKFARKAGFGFVVG